MKLARGMSYGDVIAMWAELLDEAEQRGIKDCIAALNSSELSHVIGPVRVLRALLDTQRKRDTCEHGNAWCDSRGALLTPPCGCYGGISAKDIQDGQDDAKAGRMVNLEDAFDDAKEENNG